MTKKPQICVDFDGVIHLYTSGWQGPCHVSDGPVPGAFEWLKEMTEHFEVCIYSARSKEDGGIQAMADWFVAQGFGTYQMVYALLQFPTQKPSAIITIDDRAICFEGVFPTAQAIRDFKPWNKR